MPMKIANNKPNGGTQRMSTSNFKHDTNSVRPAARGLRGLLTGCTALTLVTAIGMSGSALAAVTVASGTTVNTSTITTASGAVTLSGGTLNFSSTSTLSNAVAATTATTSTITAGSYTGTLTGALSGKGAINLNSGTLILNNSTDLANYTGLVTIASGATLQLGNTSASLIGGTTVGGSSIVDNGTLIVSATGSSASTNTLYSAISGTGTFSLTTGSLYLTGTNTYTGTTTVASGAVLYIGNASNYGSISSSSDVVVSGTLDFNRNDTYTYGGNITGSGVVIQVGGGTLILNGNSVLTGASTLTTNSTLGVTVGYLGALRASSGTIQIGDASHKTASITVPLANILSGASISGFGTLNGNLINGDDTAGTTMSKYSSTSQLVGGILKPGDGTTVGTLTINGNYTQGTYGALLITATPSEVSQLKVTGTASLHGQVSVSGSTGTYAVGLYPILTASSITGTFDTVLTGDPDSTKAFGIYYATSGKEVDLVVASKSIGQVYGDVVVHNFDTAFSLNEVVGDHASFGGRNGLSVWMRAYHDLSSTDAGNGGSAFASHTLGVIGGIDYRFGSGMSFHVAASSSTGNLHVHDNSAATDNNHLFGSLAGHVPVGPVVFDASVFYMDASSDVTRTDSYSNTLTSSLTNSVSGASIQVGAPFFNGDLVPFGKATFTYLTSGTAAETGGGPNLLAVSHGHQASQRYQVGVRASHTYVAGDDIAISPQLLLAAETNDRSLGQTNLMKMMSGNYFYAPSPTPDRVAGLARVGVDVTTQALTIHLAAGGRVSGNQDELSLDFGAAYHF
jgi:autotransporter-associated beta strand protein